ncbi:Sensory transduction protein regX3 [compost metagenome]
MSTLLIVEDDRETNEAITEYLRVAGHKVISAFDGKEALQHFRVHEIHLVVLDIMLPKITGLSVLEEIRKFSAVPVLMLSAIHDEYTQVISFDVLADDYMTKPFSMVLLGKRINALLRRGDQKQDLEVIIFGEIKVDFSGYTANDANGKIDITPKEIDLLKLLIENKGLVLTRAQILDEIWGNDYTIIDRTIDTYIKNIRKKLRLDCIVTVKGIGYKFEAGI